MSKKSKARTLAIQSAKAATQGSGTFRRGTCLACVVRTGKADRRASLSFNTLTGFYQCFKCGIVGRLDGYEAADLHLLPSDEKPDMDPPHGFYELMRGDGRGAMALEPARKFLRKRGLTDERVWREAHVGACIEGFFTDRVVVPVLSPDGDWQGFVARAWVKKHEKPYLYPKGFQRRDVLYNHKALMPQWDPSLDAAGRLTGDLPPVFVVEGVMDALALWPDAVAILGKPSEPQIYALAESPRPVAVCLDGDAWQEGEDLAMLLQLEGQRAGSIRLPPTKDPDEVPRQWLDEEARRCL